ncbi:hypothetical protein CHLRE_01g046800v5 [Chlamydomonas reinhardtii]|uniref:Uncharacterized protein n=1 Tax=Chlamydomonas reinhardtii TaxID=3055 RepID=A0A2K3E7S0_CHLRE|nr:uncharacterized protein CHLRE_01g046800v5 [Chlamydomonas reinhardtii]PNW88834.1 hypothetical protein CHLRE_01g046800v5 [Chlamydomonas reinhardtii]
MLAPPAGWLYGNYCHSRRQGFLSHVFSSSHRRHPDQSGPVHGLEGIVTRRHALAPLRPGLPAGRGHAAAAGGPHAALAAGRGGVDRAVQPHVPRRLQPRHRPARLLLPVAHRLGVLHLLHLHRLRAHDCVGVLELEDHAQAPPRLAPHPPRPPLRRVGLEPCARERTAGAVGV